MHCFTIGYVGCKKTQDGQVSTECVQAFHKPINSRCQMSNTFLIVVPPKNRPVGDNLPAVREVLQEACLKGSQKSLFQDPPPFPPDPPLQAFLAALYPKQNRNSYMLP